MAACCHIILQRSGGFDGCSLSDLIRMQPRYLMTGNELYRGSEVVHAVFGEGMNKAQISCSHYAGY